MSQAMERLSGKRIGERMKAKTAGSLKPLNGFLKYSNIISLSIYHGLLEHIQLFVPAFYIILCMWVLHLLVICFGGEGRGEARSHKICHNFSCRDIYASFNNIKYDKSVRDNCTPSSILFTELGTTARIMKRFSSSPLLSFQVIFGI